METPESSVKTLRLLHFVFLATIPLYFLAGEFVAPAEVQAPEVLRYALLFMAVTNVGLAVFVGRRPAAAAEETLLREPNDPAALARWRGSNILSFVLCEAVGMFGLVARILGGTLLDAAPFYVVSFVLLLMWIPRPQFLRA